MQKWRAKIFFRPIIGSEHLHENSKNNGVRAISFAT
jgi:hypothetical protein